MAGGQVISVAGDVLTASRVNTYWMDQAIMKVTSGTRPTVAAQGGALLAGMSIFETDTGKFQQYTTGTTLWVPPWNLPWGELNSVQVVAPQTGIGAGTPTALTGLTLTITVVANRKIKITGLVENFSPSVTLVGGLYVYDGGTGGTLVGAYNFTPTGASNDGAIIIVRTVPSVGAHTWALFANTSTGTMSMGAASGTTTRAGMIQVEDIGPNALYA